MLNVGDRVTAESETVGRAARKGIVLEVVGDEQRPRYRIEWEDGHESIYTPSAGALHLAKG